MRFSLVGKLNISPAKLLGRPLDDFYEDVADAVESDMQQRSPVRKGRLKAGWKRVVGSSMGGARNPVRHAPFQAFGTSRHPPAPGFWDAGVKAAGKTKKQEARKAARAIEREWAKGGKRIG